MNEHCINVRAFDIDDDGFGLFLDLNDDSTFVVDEMSNEIGLKFDSSTYIYYKDEKIGKLRLPFDHEKPNIHVTLFDSFARKNKDITHKTNENMETTIDSGVYKEFVECYLDAEVFITKYLIENGFIKFESMKENDI